MYSDRILSIFFDTRPFIYLLEILTNHQIPSFSMGLFDTIEIGITCPRCNSYHESLQSKDLDSMMRQYYGGDEVSVGDGIYTTSKFQEKIIHGGFHAYSYCRSCEEMLVVAVLLHEGKIDEIQFNHDLCRIDWDPAAFCPLHDVLIYEKLDRETAEIVRVVTRKWDGTQFCVTHRSNHC